MSIDGADLGVPADKAMRAAIGGEQPTEDDMMDPVQFEQYLLSAQPNEATYEGTARYAARLILEHLKKNPADASIPTERQYERDANGRLALDKNGDLIKTDERNLGDVMFATYPEFHELGLTGFQWGWAVNAARRCLELPSVPNPAIVTIGGDD